MELQIENMGKTLKMLRDRSGLLRSNVSSRSGVHPVTIQNYETRNTFVQLSIIKELLKVYGYDMHIVVERRDR